MISRWATNPEDRFEKGLAFDYFLALSFCANVVFIINVELERLVLKIKQGYFRHIKRRDERTIG